MYIICCPLIFILMEKLQSCFCYINRIEKLSIFKLKKFRLLVLLVYKDNK